MMWQDILVESEVDRQTLVRALAETFGVAEAEVEVVADIEAATACKVTCHSQAKSGQFPLLLSIYVKTDTAPDAISGARELCRLLRRRLLIDGDTENPYLMRLVDSDTVQAVNVEVDALDERDEYIVAGHP